MADKISRVPGPDGSQIKAEIVEFKTEREEWNAYKLEDGTTLRIKINLIQVARGLDENGGVLYLANGEPYYSAKQAVQIVADVPEFLMKADGQ